MCPAAATPRLPPYPEPAGRGAPPHRCVAGGVAARRPTLLLLAWLLLAAGGCAPSADAPASLDAVLGEAAALRAAGETEEAAYVLRRAIARQPEAPALHVELARLDLERDRADLALSSLRKARALGASADALAELEALALYRDGAFAQLAALELAPALAPLTRFRVTWLQAKAVAERDYALEEDTFATFRALLVTRDGLDDAARAALRADGFDAALAELRAALPVVERAWAHHVCAAAPATTTRWQPAPVAPGRRVLRVGADAPYQHIADAAAAARDGDVVEIAPGDYPGDVVIWPQSDLLVRGVGGRPHVSADGRYVARRDVWLFTGDEVVVENVEISGARSPEFGNGAAIRHTGRNLTLRHVHLHHSENGLLTAKRPESSTLIEFSEFDHNGAGDGLTHNIYVGRSAAFTMRYSYSHDSHVGHLVKSRALTTVLEYNRLTDEAGDGSYVIDTPNGGDVLVLGNVLEQGAAAVNKHLLSYAAEAPLHPVARLRVAYNSVYNRVLEGVLVRLHVDPELEVANNVVAGAPMALVMGGMALSNAWRMGNVTRIDHGLAEPREYRFEPTADSPVVDASVDVGPLPEREYVHPLGWRPRPAVYRPDVGAYEVCLSALSP